MIRFKSQVNKQRTKFMEDLKRSVTPESAEGRVIYPQTRSSEDKVVPPSVGAGDDVTTQRRRGYRCKNTSCVKNIFDRHLVIRV